MKNERIRDDGLSKKKVADAESKITAAKRKADRHDWAGNDPYDR